jgi:hypothetical protein
MPSTKKIQKAAAARAQAAKFQKKAVEVVEIPSDMATGSDYSDIECTGWTGGVNYVPSDMDTDTGDED